MAARAGVDRSGGQHVAAGPQGDAVGAHLALVAARLTTVGATTNTMKNSMVTVSYCFDFGIATSNDDGAATPVRAPPFFDEKNGDCYRVRMDRRCIGRSSPEADEGTVSRFRDAQVGVSPA